MITWKFDLEKQAEYYQTVKKQLTVNKTLLDLKYYVLPTMPEKFRGRVIFLPKVCDPKKIYLKQKLRLEKLEKDWNNQQTEFQKKLITKFAKLYEVDIVISPSFYGSIGWYGFWDNGKIMLLRPRYDRKILDIQKLVINALTHYFCISKDSNLNERLWLKKQKLAKKYQAEILGLKPESKNMHDILDSQFSGKLAQKSIEYLKELDILKPSKVKVIKKLTKSESNIFNLLNEHVGKLVSYDEIAKSIWGENYFDKYSEYAITKHIENLKKKITKNPIHSQRGYGYLLY
jgi:biotin operon repressor